MLDEPAHPAWQDTKIDERFVKLLGSMKESCVTIISEISQSLQNIEEEGERLALLVDPMVGRKYHFSDFLDGE